MTKYDGLCQDVNGNDLYEGELVKVKFTLHRTLDTSVEGEHKGHLNRDYHNGRLTVTFISKWFNFSSYCTTTVRQVVVSGDKYVDNIRLYKL